MAMGMTYEQYWDGEVGMKTAFRKTFQKRVEYDQRIADRNAWLTGQYMIKVLNAVPLLVAGLNVKRGTSLPDYPDKPFYETYDEQKKEEDNAKKREDQTRLAMAMFQAGIERFNRNLMKQQEQAKDDTSGQ